MKRSMNVAGGCLKILFMVFLPFMSIAYGKKEIPQRSPEFMPRGVYWPGEYFPKDNAKKIDWKKVEVLLDSLKAQNVNAVWLTHCTVDVGAKFAELAKKRGVFIVASLSNLAFNSPNVRKANYEALVKKTIDGWGEAPKPIAWGLGDEPRTPYIHEMADYVATWRKAGEPVTSVVMAGDTPTAIALCNFNFICSDLYPFFSKGCPNGPSTLSQSGNYIDKAMEQMLIRTKNHEKMGVWFMGGSFQEPKGPFKYDAKGNLVYLSGSNCTFSQPTPNEVHWQIWTSIASGARGIFIFSLFFNPRVRPNAKPINSSLAVPYKKEWNSGMPGGLLYMDGGTTPNYEAMGNCYKRVSKVGKLITELVPSKELIAFHSKGWPRIGDMVRNFQTPDGTCYAVIVNGDIENKAEVPVNIQKSVTKITDMVTGRELETISKAKKSWEPIGAPFKQVRVKLLPGRGTILRLDK